MTPSDRDPDDPVTTRERRLEAVVRFARRLRRAGVDVPGDAALVATEALASVGVRDEATVRAATRATLCTCQADLPTFERLFEQFWRELTPDDGPHQEVMDDLADAVNTQELSSPAEATRTDPGDDAERDEADPGERDEAVTAPAGAASGTSPTATDDAVEVAAYSPVGKSTAVERGPAHEHAGLAGPVGRLTRTLSIMPGRRHTAATSGRFVDARRALRASVGTGGVPAALPEAAPTETVTRGVVFVDVSQSVLDTVDRSFLLAWLRELADQWRSLRVFFFDTDVREVTDAFDERTVGDVYDALERAEAAWGGGTRIGHALATVRREHPTAVDNRTVVLVVSDGLERGDVDVLAESTAWLSRNAPLVLWLNPLATSPDYEPTARGMAAAMPAVDGLFAFAGVEDVTELARQLERADRTRIGYEFDPRRRVRADGSGAARPAGDAPARHETTTGRRDRGEFPRT